MPQIFYVLANDNEWYKHNELEFKFYGGIWNTEITSHVLDICQVPGYSVSRFFEDQHKSGRACKVPIPPPDTSRGTETGIITPNGTRRPLLLQPQVGKVKGRILCRD